MLGTRKNILICNDDGVRAKGLSALIDMVRPYGNVLVVAPEIGQSGMSHSISISKPLRADLLEESEGLKIYSINGTPADCVKIAVNQLCEQKPDIMLSGINHGSNSAISLIYSGTMGAAVEAALLGIPSIGYSVEDHSPNADFSLVKKHGLKIFTSVLEHGLPHQVSLNVNFPVVSENDFNGIKICRQTRGVWDESFDERIDPFGGKYYWLTGSFKNEEAKAVDTDEWALKNNYASVVPVFPDYTEYNTIEIIKKWNIHHE